jgi:hypothetical protein
VQSVTCSENQLYWNFACAEVRSPRYGSAYNEFLGPRLAGLVRGADATRLQSSDWDLVRRAVIRIREPIVGQLPFLDFAWFLGEVAIEELALVRLMNVVHFAAFAASRTLAEFVRRLDDGDAPTGDEKFAANYRRFREQFDPAKVVGRPIMLVPHLDGPYTELEGLTRLSTLLSKWNHSEPVPATVPVLLGVSERVNEWSWC